MPSRSLAFRLPAAWPLAAWFVSAACAEQRPPATLPIAGEFSVLDAEPAPGSALRLNEPIRLTCSEDVDLATVGFDSVRFAVADHAGNPLGEQPRGTFRVRAATDGSPDNRRVLEFVPTIGASRDEGGFRLGRRYALDLRADAPARVRSTSGRPVRPATFEFATPPVGARDVHLDPRPGLGPRLRGVRATPSRAGQVALGSPSAALVEVHLDFDQPLDPSPENVPIALDPAPARIDARGIDPATKGRIFLEYDDPVFGRDTWIPARVDLLGNTNDGSLVVLTPVGVLPSGAQVRVVVEPTLRDLAGEDNQRDGTYRRVAHELATESATEPRFAALVETFATPDHLDFDAPLDEPLAAWEPGQLAAADALFDGTTLDYEPRELDILLNTDVTEITAGGRSRTVTGGVFHFRNVTIPRGVSVRGIGTKPMVWIVEGDLDLGGTLSVDGRAGQMAIGFRSAVHMAPGGVGVCGGGAGGAGSPSQTEHDLQGQDGFGPFGAPAGGGRGGLHSCNVAGCTRGGGGGGGSFASRGDPHHVSVSFGGLPRVGLGAGGGMCSLMLGPRATAGPLAFVDARADNDFFGRGVDLRRGIGIAGELTTLRGGSGGGGGGDTGLCAANHPIWNNWFGGGGGGGGGALLLQVRGRVILRQGAQIRAEGGAGGGGSQAGTSGSAGGGGGGSGGMIVVMAGAGIHIVVHGAPYAEAAPTSAVGGAYDFAISADGGAGHRTGYLGSPIAGKYPGGGGSATASVWDLNPIGGFGGLGLVQLMVPPGENLPLGAGGDDTATRLDDNVFFYRDDAALAQGLRAVNPHAVVGGALTGYLKARYLGWRGLRDEQGIGRDDAGDVVVLPRDDHGEGDIRPSPILLPSPVGALSRARSAWLDLGAVVRRPDGEGPRLIREQIDPDAPDDPTRSFRAGPSLSFAATHDGVSGPAGYVRTREAFGTLLSDAPAVLPAPVAVAEVVAGNTRALPAHVVRLSEPAAVLARPAGRYVGYRAELASADGYSGSYRILAHTAQSVVVGADDEAMLPRITTLQIRAEFFAVRRGGDIGFGEGVIDGAGVVPAGNVRIGFALHVDPTRRRAGIDPLRYPADSREFLFGLDLSRPETLRGVRDFAQRQAATRGTLALQWDVTFNDAYSPSAPRAVDPRRPSPPRRERLSLRYLVIPVQF